MIQDSTVNPDEVTFYRQLADTWWDLSGPFWPLHRLNKLRVAYIVDRLGTHFGFDSGMNRPLQGLRVLDVGCGGGILSESMASLGADVVGIDVVEKNIRIATLHAQQQNLAVQYEVSTVDALLQRDTEPFDVVLNMEVVEHVADVTAFMRACNRLTRSGGVMFVATINRTMLSWVFAIVGAEYVLRWLPRGTHRWRDFRKPEDIEQLLAEDGLRVEFATGVTVNPLTRSFRLTRNLAVNYMLMAVR